MLQKLMEQRAKARSEESGFTLIELLVVIIILGILAAVVVFAVSGINDKGQTSACKIDTRTIRTAQEAFFATPVGGLKTTPAGSYAPDAATLKAQGFLSDVPTYHTTDTAVAPYEIKTAATTDGGKCTVPSGTTTGVVVDGTNAV